MPRVGLARRWGNVLVLWIASFFGGESLALDWTRTLISSVQQTYSREYVYEFSFTNRSDEPVMILDLEPSCDCLRLELSGREIAPRGRGVLRVVFTTGARTGLQKKQVRVWTSDRPNLATTLSLNVRLPEAFVLSPTVVSWKSGESGLRRIQFASAPNRDVTIKEVACDNVNFKVYSRREHPAGPTVILVDRESPEKPTKGRIRLRLEGDHGFTGVAFITLAAQ